jgi:hypothetical protein
MARIPNPAVDNPIGYLISVHYPEYPNYIKEVMTQIKGRDTPRKSPPPELQQSVLAYKAKLKKMSPNQLAVLVSEAKDIAEKRRLSALEAEETARWYNQSTSVADFEYWAKMSYWTLEELTALSMGKNPSAVSWEKISPYLNLSPFVKEYQRRLTIVTRAKVMGQLWGSTYPNLALAWARRMKFSMPIELSSEVEALGIQIADWKDLYEKLSKQKAELIVTLEEERDALKNALNNCFESHKRYAADAIATIDSFKENLETVKAQRDDLSERYAGLVGETTKDKAAKLGSRERESLLKLIIGMAVDGYGYQPKVGRSPLAGDLSGHLHRLGIPLSDDTIRNFLNEAKDLLPGENPSGGI